MGILLKLIVVAVIGGGAWYTFRCCCPPKPPHINFDEWWGPKELKGRQETSIRPFQVKFGEAVIQDLRARLKNHRPFTPPLEGAAFTYGFNSKQLESWTNYWTEEYQFTQREKFFNKYPQFKTNIQGLDIHFIRITPQKSKGVQTVPLLLMHGWPGSVREFYEAIPFLTQPTGYDFVFEVVIPSLPGYGFSDAAGRPGLAIPQVAGILSKLMHRLGHKQYYIQGGDWGAAIASAMTTLFPDEILGQHSNMLVVQNNCAKIRTMIGAVLPSLIVDDHLADRMYPLSSFFAYFMEEFGYFHLQATKPDTIGVALTDSPTGLLAYILEKFSTWTVLEYKKRDDGGLTERFTKEQLIDNLMLYWITNSITTSMRYYAENMSQKVRDLNLDAISTSVPTWALQAKNELFYQPPNILKLKFSNLLNTTVLEEGGHFIAMELPKVFAEDVYKAVHAFREWHKAKKDKSEL